MTEESGLFSVCRSKQSENTEGYHIIENIDSYIIEFKGTGRLYKMLGMERTGEFSPVTFNAACNYMREYICMPSMLLIESRMRKPLINSESARITFSGFVRTFLESKVMITINTVTRRFILCISRE